MAAFSANIVPVSSGSGSPSAPLTRLDPERGQQLAHLGELAGLWVA
jgi:hypothetical protein